MHKRSIKECPTCKRTYADETLTFCLADGTLLSAPYDPDATLVMPTADRTSNARDATIPSPSFPQVSQPGAQKTGHRWIFAIAGLLVLLIVVAGGAGILLMWRSFSTKTGPPRNHSLRQYRQDGVQFSYYSDWSVTRDAPIEDTPTARSIDIEGPNSALFNIICLPASSTTTVEEFAEQVAHERAAATNEALRKKGLAKASTDKGTSEPITDRILGQQQNGIRQRFTVRVGGTEVPHEASFFLFKGGPYKVVVMTQAAEDHIEETRVAWRLIFGTLKIEDSR